MAVQDGSDSGSEIHWVAQDRWSSTQHDAIGARAMQRLAAVSEADQSFRGASSAA
jgi:hypothetical protein